MSIYEHNERIARNHLDVAMQFISDNPGKEISTIDLMRRYEISSYIADILFEMIDAELRKQTMKGEIP